MSAAASESIDPAARPVGSIWRAKPVLRLFAFGRRHRALTVLGLLATAALLAWVLAGRREEFTSALASVPAWVIVVTVLLQALALVSRSEAWHLTIEAAGGAVSRRVLYRAASVQVLGGTLNSHLGVAARIARCGARPQTPAHRCRP
jgi:uncharacterized membrane protein YbhN (UPF0104 family)